MFTWFAEAMPGIDHSVICHRLHLDPTARLVIQRKQNHKAEQSKIIVAEIDKLNDTNFIDEVHHPDWLANVILVHKKNGK